MRGRVGMLAVVLGAVVVCGCGRQTPSPAPDRIVVGVCDPLAVETASPCVRASAKREYGEFVSALGRRTGLEIVLKYCASDRDLSEAIAAGEVNAAVGKTWTILRAAKASGRTFRRLADLPGPGGESELTGVFIVRRDSPLKTLADLDGRTVALGPDAAYEKSHAARRALEAAGATPRAVRVLDGCVPVAAAVFEKELDAGVVSHYVVDFNGLALVSDPDDFRVIGRTAPIPFMTFAVSGEVDERHGGDLYDALLGSSRLKPPVGLQTAGFDVPTTWSPPELEKK